MNAHKRLLTILSICVLFSCDYRQSINKDLVTGLVTTGSGLSAEEVYLSDSNGKINRSTFIYGEKINFNFENMEGFKKENEAAFPGLKFLVKAAAGDTMLFLPDLYIDNKDGFSFSPLLLTTYLTVAAPMSVANTYTIYVDIWDKKGEGKFTAELDFDIIANDKIKIASNNLDYSNIYLFSNETGLTIVDNKIDPNNEIYILIEGLTGLAETDGMVEIGLKMLATDASGQILVQEEDLLADSPLNSEEVRQQLSPNFSLTGEGIQFPVYCEIAVWDKNSEKSLKITTTLEKK